VKAIRQGIEAEVKARQTVASAIHSTADNVDQSEIIKLLEEEMLEAARNLEFERAAQLRDKINEMKGAPILKSGNAFNPADSEGEQQKIWQPKTSTRHGRKVAK
jgi:excinuclease ABC subunit B